MFTKKAIDLSAISFVRCLRLRIHLTNHVQSGKLWRQQNGLAKLQTAKGPLIDTPDYSFLNNRPAPLSIGQMRRKELQEILSRQAVNGLNFLKVCQEYGDKISKKEMLDSSNQKF